MAIVGCIVSEVGYMVSEIDGCRGLGETGYDAYRAGFCSRRYSQSLQPGTNRPVQVDFRICICVVGHAHHLDFCDAQLVAIE